MPNELFAINKQCLHPLYEAISSEPLKQIKQKMGLIWSSFLICIGTPYPPPPHTHTHPNVIQWLPVIKLDLHF